MTVHQRFNQPAYEFHPELGYLCPSRQLRQNVRVGLAAAAFGIVAGVAGAVALLPRHSADLARSEAVLAAEPAGQVSDPTPLTSSNPSIAPSAAPSSTTARVSSGGVVKRRVWAARTSPAVGTAPAVESPAAPAIITDRGTAAVSGPEHVRTVTRKRVRTANSSARRRGQET